MSLHALYLVVKVVRFFYFFISEKDKKGFRASLLMASMDHKAIIEFKEKIMRGTKILECYSTMQKIKVGRYYA